MPDRIPAFTEKSVPTAYQASLAGITKAYVDDVLMYPDGVTSIPYPNGWSSVIPSSINGITKRQPRNKAIKVFYGRISATHAVDGTSGTTYLSVFTLTEVADAVRPIFANGGTATYTVASVKAAPIVSESDLNLSGTSSAWVSGTIPSSGVVPVRSATNNPGILVGDWIELDNSSSSSGSRMIGVRTFIDAGAGTITIMGNGANGASENFTSWATRSGQVNAFRQKTGDCNTTIANFDSTTNVSYSPCIGLEYISRGKVYTIMVSGDSIDAGRGTYITENQMHLFAESIRSVGSRNFAIEVANIAWPGASSTATKLLAEIYMTAGLLPDFMVYPAGSPNDISTSISDAAVVVWRKAVAYQKLLCETNNVDFWLRTMTPAKNESAAAGSGAEAYGTDDVKRINWNNEVVSWRKRGQVVLDWATAIAGTTDSAGMQGMKSDFTTDGIHPNTTGNTYISNDPRCALPL